MTKQELLEVAELRQQLDEAQDTLRAIRSGEVDALVVPGAAGREQLYVLSGAEQPYLIFLETMSQGAATLTPQGVISYSNQGFAKLLNTSLEQVIGANLEAFVAPPQKGRLRFLLEQAHAGTIKRDMAFEAGGATVEAELALTPLNPGGGGAICLIASEVTERNKASEMRAYLALVVASSNDAIISKTLDGTVVSWNNGAAKLYGYSAEEIIGQPISRLCPPDHPDEIAAILERVSGGETVDRYETERIRKDGERIQVSITVSPMHDHAGRVTGASVVARDVTGQKRAEESLRQLNEELENRVGERTAELRYSEERLTLALQASQEGVWDWNIETDEVWYSPRWKEMLGYAESEIESRFSVWEQLLHPDDRKGAGEVVDAVLRGEREFEVEYRLRHKDGHYLDVLSRGFPVRREAGGPLVRMVGTHFDLTERKQMEEALHARTKELEAATAQLQTDNRVINVIRQLQAEFIDTELSVSAWNEMLEVMVEGSGSAFGFIGELFSPPAGEPYLTPRALSDVAWDKESLEQYRQFLSGDLRFTNFESLYGAPVTTGKPVFANDDATVARRGRPEAGHPPLKTFLGLPLYSNKEVVGVMAVANRPAGYGEEQMRYLEPMAAACGNVIKALKLNRQRQADEAEFRRLNTDLERRSVELQAANKELEAFSYSVSHDLRAPLRAIEGFSSVLLEDYAGKLDAEGNHLLDRMRIASRRMDELIDGLLALSRSTRNEMHCATVDLSQLAQGVAMELQKRNPGRRIDWQIAPGMAVSADAGLLRSALENLLGNSFKFTGKHEQARIEVGSVQNNGNEPVYFVRDDGAGFDMRHASKMFGAFQRFHTVDEFEGAGIGLANVQRIVHRHGGRIWAEGELEKGATFFFTLPQTSLPGFA